MPVHNVVRSKNPPEWARAVEQRAAAVLACLLESTPCHRFARAFFNIAPRCANSGARSKWDDTHFGGR